MCGLAGVLVREGAEPPGAEELRRMVAMLEHRGPDGYGLYRDARIGLAQARLSIVDLEGGFQPIRNEEGTIWVCVNGEIFNHVDLRRDLEARGHRFYTHSDTEVVVHCFEEFGEEAWGRLNGQFAIALWDGRARRLWLVRDRFGIVPLHIVDTGDAVLFASEAKALFAGGRISPELDPDSVVELFSHWSVMPPKTIFKGVGMVPPGTAIAIDGALGRRERVYWQADFSLNPELEALSLDDAADALGEHLGQAVAIRLRADVPVGAYLSGGLDSSVIGAAARDAESSPLATFAIRFEDPAFDETEAQRRMAGLLGTDHHEILCGAEGIAAALPDVVWHAESPLLRTAPAPLFHLSGLVRDAGMKVVLTGEGADELLAGYNIFKENKVRRFWAQQPDSTMRPALLDRIYPYVGGGRPRHSSAWRSFFGQGLTDLADPFYSHRIRWRNTAWSHRFLSPELRQAATPEPAEERLLARMPTGWQHWDPLARAQRIEIDTFMSPYLLAMQGDRVAMAHGVEVRYPFLDPNLVDFCLGLPARFKLPGLRDKAILRRYASRRLPPEIWRRPKHPYRAPTTTGLFHPTNAEWVEDVLSEDSLGKWGLASVATTRALLSKARGRNGHLPGEREEMALVGMVTLQLLARDYLGDFGSRASRMRTRLDRLTPRVDEYGSPGQSLVGAGLETL